MTEIHRNCLEERTETYKGLTYTETVERKQETFNDV